ncbi:MAG: exo-alpha-sialidase, partial [Ignavibacteriaceae bacterium]|nr:exo-alpha-sialidase [Ignavibacteriaceae bacterium]
MKNKLPKNILLTFTILLVLISMNRLVYSQEDDPNIDRVPIEWLENINYSDSEEDVITDNDGYDNFNLGVDFAEPHLSQNPNNPLQYFGAYNINNAWRTSDGHNWTGSTPVFGVSVNGDPCTAYDGAGNLYYESMFGGVTGCKVMRSTNNGATWSAAVTAISGNDKNWMAADQTTGPYANFIYTVMTPGNFARSTNFGATWTTTATFSTQTLPGMMVCVGPNGTTDGGAVYVVTNSGSSFASTYTFYVSTNGGLNFTQKSAQNFANYVGTDVNGRNSVQNMRTRPYPFIAADQSNGTYRGRFYLVYASNTPAGNGNKPDIFCRYSTNQGTTWSSAIRVNDDLNTTANHQWHPSIWCDKSSGRLYVKWMDTRDTPSSDSAYIYASYSDNGGVTWAPNQRISNQKMKINCSTCGGGGTPRYQGDYDAIVSTNNQAMMMWTDFRFGDFGSYVAYFPDFAMKVSPSNSTIDNNNDSAFININVPGVKLYNSSAIFSANITPTPPSGTFIIDFPQGNTLSSFPGDVAMRIRTSGNVTLGNYTINIKGEGPNGTPVHLRTASIQVVVPALDFGVDLIVSDDCANQVSLKFGTAPGATDCYDPYLDFSAPPPPPAGAFDGRLASCGEHWFTDIRGTNTSGERIWTVLYTPASDCSPASFSWNPAQLPPTGYFHLVDPIYGNLVNVNMRTTNQYTDMTGLGLGQLQ